METPSVRPESVPAETQNLIGKKPVFLTFIAEEIAHHLREAEFATSRKMYETGGRHRAKAEALAAVLSKFSSKFSGNAEEQPKTEECPGAETRPDQSGFPNREPALAAFRDWLAFGEKTSAIREFDRVFPAVSATAAPIRLSSVTGLSWAWLRTQPTETLSDLSETILDELNERAEGWSATPNDGKP